jgi:RNA polymerase sigma factor (sigma-70 family)
MLTFKTLNERVMTMRLYDFETHFEAEMALMTSDDDTISGLGSATQLFRHQNDGEDSDANALLDDDSSHDTATDLDNSSTKDDNLASLELSAFKSYTLEIGQFALLDAEQEKAIARQIDDGCLALQRLLARHPSGRSALIAALLDQPGSDSDGDGADGGDAKLELLRNTLSMHQELSHAGAEQPSAALERTEHLLEQCLEQQDIARDLMLSLANSLLAPGQRHLDKAFISSVRKAQQRILRARDRLVEGNLRLVLYVAKRFRDRGVDMEDLIQEGNLGLMRAAIKFDAAAGVRFSTYGFWWISQAMRQCITRNRSLIRYPNHVAEQINRVSRLMYQHQMRHGEAAPAKQIAKDARIPLARMEDLLSLSNICVSLARPLGQESQLLLEDTLSDEEDWARPFENAWQREQQHLLDNLLDTLEPRDAIIMRLKYGIGYRKSYSLREIADQLGISKERVRQIVDRSTLGLRERHPDLLDSFGHQEGTLDMRKRTAKA